MALLPKLETPTFYGKIPSTGEEFEFRPFLVKEQKILLMAIESEDQKQIFIAFRDIVNTCVTKFRGAEINENNRFDVESLPTFDAESIFLQISAKSIGEESEIGLQCEKCEAVNTVKINLENDISVKNLEDFSKKPENIKITDSVGVVLRFPSMKDNLDVMMNNSPKKQVEQTYSMIIASISMIYDENETYDTSDFSERELSEFIDSLSIKQLKKIEDFFINSPYLATDTSFKCSSCGAQNEKEIKGLNSFF